MQLQQKPVNGKLDMAHLQKIHKHIFQDVYPFAGKIREVDIAKPGTLFARTIHILGQAEEMFNRLKNEHFLVGMKAEQFSARAADYMADINALHPFRP
ncbi:Fic/DOC family protein [Paenibacillus dendritiformis]|uniref:Fic/DOC family protein n=1 Tax=Paenibacillus dendritiformis TaxID=130049 RepID=UPI0018CD063D|nr:Fic family protein [Paenibacillus dendritiformis]